MAWPWVILGRVPRVVPGDDEADGEDEAEAHGVAEVVAGAQAEGVVEADAEHHGADFSIPVATPPPRITVITAAPTAQPDRNFHDKYPYILAVDSDCILFNFGCGPCIGLCLEDVPYKSNLIVARNFDCAGVNQGHPITAAAEHIPPRDALHAVVSNIESIGILTNVYIETYIIAELMVDKGSHEVMVVYFYAGGTKWFQERTPNPLPDRGREWVPSGVVSYRKTFWWFDLSWGIISYNPFLETEVPFLLFHQLPEGHDLGKAQRGLHDRRCIAESQGALRYVEITTPEGEAATVSMWSWISDADGNEEYIVWGMEYEISFAEIWKDDSYRATGLPHKVPVLAIVCPSDANLVYFAMVDEERLFSVNVYKRRVVDFVDESYDLVSPWPAPPSCRYIRPWFLPLEVAQAIGMNPSADFAEELQEKLIDEEEFREQLTDEEELQDERVDKEELQAGESEDQEESEPEIDYDPLAAIVHPLAAVVHDKELPVLETKDSGLPADESSSDEEKLQVKMDPETLTRLKSEVKEFFREHKGTQSQNPGPGDEAGD